MAEHTLPRTSIPAPLRGSELGTFAHDTVVRRLPAIVRRILEENHFPDQVVKNLQALIAEIPNDPIRSLMDPGAPDEEVWQIYIQPYLSCNWLEVPWFFAEFYFYRRILEAIRYFQPQKQGYLLDPYVHQKKMGLESARNLMEPLATLTNKWVAAKEWSSDALAHFLQIALWGNRADMSIWPITKGDQARMNLGEENREKIIVNHSQDLTQYLSDLKSGAIRMDILLDNAGFELISDLFLTDYLMSSGLAYSVVLHLKACPVFVSDALIKDVEDTLVFMDHQPSQEIQSLLIRLQHHLHRKHLIIRDETFWTSPLALWEMPDYLRSELQTSDLVIIKGDAHYRRLLGDRHWPPTTSFSDITSYLPSPILVLRTCKSEVICGLKPGQAKALQEKDPRWMTNGQWGLIQFRK